MRVFAVIPAGGKGLRTSSSLPKQYIKFFGKELIAYTLEVFQNCNLVDKIIVAAQKDFFHTINSIKERYSFAKLNNPIEGGIERQFSVFNAVKSINAEAEDLLVVHDAVRPLLSEEILVNSITTAIEFGSSVVALKAKDTLINGTEIINNYLDRKHVYYVQTPQVFKYSIFIDAMNKAESSNFIGTDESILVHRAGYKIKIVDGSSFNFKITSDDDLKMFESLIKK